VAHGPAALLDRHLPRSAHDRGYSHYWAVRNSHTASVYRKRHPQPCHAHHHSTTKRDRSERARFGYRLHARGHSLLACNGDANRPSHTRPHTHADGSGPSLKNTNPSPHSHADAVGHSHSHPTPDRDTHFSADRHPTTNGHPHAVADGDPYTHTTH
jgi:hypothetical protein